MTFFCCPNGSNRKKKVVKFVSVWGLVCFVDETSMAVGGDGKEGSPCDAYNILDTCCLALENWLRTVQDI